MLRRALLLPVLGLAMLTAGCDSSLEEGVYAGVFAQGIEDSIFQPCDADETWRLDFDEPLYEAFQAAQQEHGFHLYIEARGVPSGKGRYPGIFTEYDRVFEVEAFEGFGPASRGC